MADHKRILLAEDDPKDVELIREVMEEYRLANELVVASDGAEALDYLFCRDRYADRPGGMPGLVLLDIKMPKVDGLEVLRAIKGDPELRLIPVVILTSSREEQDLVESYRLGTNAYVVKPVNFHDFIEAVKLLGMFWLMLNQAPAGSEQ